MVFGELELRPLALRSALLLRLRAGVLDDFADLLDDFADLFDDLADERRPPAAPPEELRPLDTDIFTSSVSTPHQLGVSRTPGEQPLQYRLPNPGPNANLRDKYPAPDVRRR